MHKKVFSIALVSALAATVVGCGSSSTNAGKTAAPSTSPSATAAPTSGAKSQLRELMPYDRFDPNKDPVAAYLKEATGYDVNYEMLPAENADQKLNLLMANKEPYDFMKLTGSQFSKLATSGALEPLDDLINKYGKTMKNVISDTSWKGVKLNGKTYAIPEASAGQTVSVELVVRQDWMDELGLKMPTNSDELYNVLKTFKDKKNVIPLVGGKTPMVPDIASTFGITTNWQDVGGKLVNSVENPHMKDYLAFMNKLYSEGLIDSEWGINTGNKLIEKFSSGKAAMMDLAWYNAPPTINALTKNFPNAKVGIVPYLKDKSGKVSVVGGGGITYYIAIPKSSQHKDEAMQYLDKKLDKDIFKGLALGKEGETYSVKDGKYYPILPKFNDTWSNASYYLTGTDEKNYPIYWQARVRKDPLIQSYFETFQANAKDHLIVDPLTYAPPIEDISKNVQKLAKLTEDEYIKFITGAEPLSNYDKFVADWKSQGGEAMTKAANDWYSKNKK